MRRFADAHRIPLVLVDSDGNINALALSLIHIFRAHFRVLDTGGAVVVVLEDCYPALFDGFHHIEGGLVVFQLIQLRLGADMVNGFVQQVAFARR